LRLKNPIHCFVSALLLERSFLVDVFGASAAVAGFAGGDEVLEVVGASGVPCDDVVYFGGWGSSAPYADGVVGEDYFAVALELGGGTSCHCLALSVALPRPSGLGSASTCGLAAFDVG
jgi:hypothetical protein